jgi:hypothetical protein
MSDKPKSDQKSDLPVTVNSEFTERALFDDVSAPWSSHLRELLKDRDKPFPLNLDGKVFGHTLIVGATSTGPMPDAHYHRVSEWALALNGRDFATLSQLELNQFRALRAAGSKFGLLVSVEVIHDDEIIQAELAAASPEQKEEIYRRLKTEIAVRWAVLDKEVNPPNFSG